MQCKDLMIEKKNCLAVNLSHSIITSFSQKKGIVCAKLLCNFNLSSDSRFRIKFENLFKTAKNIKMHPKSWMFDKFTRQLGDFFGQVKDHRRSNASYSLSDSLKGAFAMFSLKSPSLLVLMVRDIIALAKNPVLIV